MTGVYEEKDLAVAGRPIDIGDDPRAGCHLYELFIRGVGITHIYAASQEAIFGQVTTVEACGEAWVQFLAFSRVHPSGTELMWFRVEDIRVIGNALPDKAMRPAATARVPEPPYAAPIFADGPEVE